MKALIFDMGSYVKKDILYYFQKANIDYLVMTYKISDLYQDSFLEYKIGEQLSVGQYDFVFSMNFFPIIAKMCDTYHIKYLSWTYDSPLDYSKPEYFLYEINYLFLFDRKDALIIRSLGAKNAFHLPLAVNCDRLNQITPTLSDHKIYDCDISFVGQFYSNTIGHLLQFQDDYTKGFIEALLQSQSQIYGCNLISQALSDSFVENFNTSLSNAKISTKITKAGLINTMLKHVTRSERLILLDILGQNYKTHFYSNDNPEELSHLKFQGTAYYYSEMPLVFKCSKLNLCPTLRSIESGIPLRALDILGCGGALFANYQPELAEFFEDGKEVILYDSLEDAIAKANYYLANPNLLENIAKSGYENVKNNFSYPDRIAFMLKMANLF